MYVCLHSYLAPLSVTRLETNLVEILYSSNSQLIYLTLGSCGMTYYACFLRVPIIHVCAI